MKNTILIMIMTLFLPTNFILAQPGGNLTLQPISCMSYTQNPELDKFIGTWKWVEGNDSFEIVLKKGHCPAKCVS